MSDWQFYMCAVDDHPAMIMVDVDLRDGAPDRSRPYQLRVRIPHLDEREDGLPSADERPRLDAIEDAVEEVVARHRGVNVGHAHFAAGTSVYFYVASEAVADRIAAEVEALVTDRELDVSGFDDPDWEQYTDFLYPNRLGWQWIRDREALGTLEAQGDPGEVSRRLDFTAQLPTQTAVDVFVARIGERGFRVDDADMTGDGAQPWLVQFSIELPPRDVFAVSGRISTDVDELGGIYEGWSCEAIVRN